MKITRVLGQSFRSIWNNKIRSSLTILGIVIGIAAVISLVGLGNGLQSSVTDRIGGLGITKITLRSQDPERETAERQPSGGPGPGGGDGGEMRFNFGGGDTETLTEEDYATVQETDDIVESSPEMSAQVDVTETADADTATATAFQLYGVDMSYAKIQEYELKSGSFITEAQVKDKESVVVIGEQAATDLFETDDVVGKEIYIKDKAFTIVGVMKTPEDAAPFNNPADNIYTGYKKWLDVQDKEAFSAIVANASSEDTVQTAAESAESQILENHEITDEAKADVGVSTSQDLLETASSVTGSFTSALAGIAGISLVVGGIGIMNIMLVTVTERTREIGLRRAVGAKTRHILVQFLIESMLLTLIGGAIGLLAGILISQQLGSLLSFMPGGGGAGSQSVQAVVDVQTMILAVGISAAIGIIFGLFPAIKASRLDPVEALRYE